MNLGSRIEARRKEVGIKSQAELARRAKVPQTTLNGLVKKPYRWSPHLARIAHELGTTVEYLVGETEDAAAEGADTGQRLSSDESEWVALYADLTEEQRKTLRKLARDLARGNAPSKRIHDRRDNYGAPGRA